MGKDSYIADAVKIYLQINHGNPVRLGISLVECVTS